MQPLVKFECTRSYETTMLQIIELALEKLTNLFIFQVLIFIQNGDSGKVTEDAVRHRSFYQFVDQRLLLFNFLIGLLDLLVMSFLLFRELP